MPKMNFTLLVEEKSDRFMNRYFNTNGARRPVIEN